MSNCVTHKKRPAVTQCESCGEPICEQCYNDFDLPDGGEHLCAECYKEECRKEAAEVRAVRSLVKHEFIFIIVGMILGIILAIAYVDGNGLFSSGSKALPIVIISFAPFVFGSLLTIAKIIIRAYNTGKENDSSEYSWIWGLVFAVLTTAFLILVSPITTIWRIVVRTRDMRRLNSIADNGLSAIALIDDYIAQTTAPSVVEQAAGGAMDATDAVEISLDSILGEGIAIGANGQVLREIRNR